MAESVSEDDVMSFLRIIADFKACIHFTRRHLNKMNTLYFTDLINSIFKDIQKAMDKKKYKKIKKIIKNFINLLTNQFFLLKLDFVLPSLVDNSIAKIHVAGTEYRINFLPKIPRIILQFVYEKLKEGDDHLTVSDNALLRRSSLIAANHGIPVNFLDQLHVLGLPLLDHESLGLPLNHGSSYKSETLSLNPNLSRIIRSFLGKTPSEAKLRVLVWDKIITEAFIKPAGEEDLFDLEPEWNAKGCLKLVGERRVDFAAISKLFSIPIVLIEIGKMPVLKGGVQKDFSKLIGMMIISCRSLCNKIFNAKGDMKLARVFGLWISGLEFRMCVAHPMIEICDGFSEISIAVSFNHHWNAGLLIENENSDCSSSCCTVSSSSELSTRKLFHHYTNTSQPSDSHQMLQFDLSSQFSDSESELNPFETLPEIDTDAPISFKSLEKFKAFIECSKYSLHRIIESLTTVENVPPPKSSDDQPIIVESLPTGKDFTPAKKRSRLSVGKNNINSPLISAADVNESNSVTDKYGREHVILCKSNDSNELNIYRMFSNISIFPFLYSFSVSKDAKHLIFDFEKMYPFDTRITNNFNLKFINEESIAHALIEASTFAVHVFCGVLHLHECFEFVHSDISPSNIMFSVKDCCWKLNDFNRSMPIKDSASTSRVSGTPNFIAPESKDTGIFTPKSDVFSIGKTIWTLFTFPIMLEAENYGMFDSEEQEDVEIITFYRKFENITKKVLQSDPESRISAFEALILFYHFLDEMIQRSPKSFCVKGHDSMILIAESIVKKKLQLKKYQPSVVEGNNEIFLNNITTNC